MDEVEVEICGNKFIVKGEESKEYVNSLAQYVECEMQKVMESTQAVSTIRVAILASLNIADEFFKMKKMVEERINKLIEKIQEKLDGIAQ